MHSQSSQNVSNGGQFNPNGCEEALSEQKKYGETQTLQIIKEFKQLYEDKMKSIEEEGADDCKQAKINLQQSWIRDLTEQNEMLVRAVEELEFEATERVMMLEEKLRTTAQCGYEVMKKYRDYDFSNNINETFQRVGYLENDLRNLIEFIRRIREERSWNIDGLQFYEISYQDLLGLETPPTSPPITEAVKEGLDEKNQLLLDEVQIKEQKIQQLQDQITQLSQHGDLQEIIQQLKKRNDDYEVLKKSMVDMRAALTAEVADKHDMVLALRHDILQLEDQCKQADKQTLFKEDIIKEMRKEMKQLKSQSQKCDDVDCDHLKNRFQQMEEENDLLKKVTSQVKEELQKLGEVAEDYLQERDQYKKKHRESIEIIEEMTLNFDNERELFERKHRESLAALEELKNKNNKALEKVQRDSTANLEKLQLLAVTPKDDQKSEHENSGSSMDMEIGKLQTNSFAFQNFVSNEVELENIHQLTDSINGMMMKSSGNAKSDTIAEHLAVIDNKNEVINLLNDTLSITNSELRALQEKETELEEKACKKNQEILNLKEVIKEFEKALKNSQERAENLQNALELSQNSINVLEASEERAKLELCQQKLTISNLQEGLVATKHQLDELQQKSNHEVSWTARWLGTSVPKNGTAHKSVHDV